MPKKKVVPKKKAAQKRRGIPDPIVTAATKLKKQLDDRAASLYSDFQREQDAAQQQILKLQIEIITGVSDHLNRDLITQPFTHFRCP
jgi:hypothetical protein